MANESKKFALLCSCLMTMQALRLVISTAGFCVVRFHIDPDLFNIFISRLVNAVLMSQLFGNWLGDLIVFGAAGQMKLYATAAANWAEFMCFCSALICIMHSEAGHLTGFYWSMVCSYFWWKVGEAPCTSIGAFEVDWYFAGFTLSGVWAACLKAVVMWCVTETVENQLNFHSDPLGDVNVNVVGARSVKTTVDYRAASLLFVLTIVLMLLMCSAWTTIAITVTQWDAEKVKKALETAGSENQDQVIAALQNVGSVAWKEKDNVWKVDFTQATGASAVTVEKGAKDENGMKNKVTISLTSVAKVGSGKWTKTASGEVKVLGDTVQARQGPSEAPKWDELVGQKGEKIGVGENKGKTVSEVIEDRMKGGLEKVQGAENIDKVSVELKQGQQMTISVTVEVKGVMGSKVDAWVTAGAVGAAFGGVLAVPGAMLGAAIGFWMAAYSIAIGQMSGDVARRHWVVLLAGFAGMTVLIAMGSGVLGGSQGATATKGGRDIATVGLLASWSAIVVCVWRVSREKVSQARAGGEGARFIKWFTVIFGVVGLVGGLVAGVCGVVKVEGVPWTAGSWKVRSSTNTGEHDEWVNKDKWAGHPQKEPTTWSALIGLGVGMVLGSLVGLILGAGKVTGPNWWYVGMSGGTLVGSFFGLITGEIFNATETWKEKNFAQVDTEISTVICGFLIVVLGLGTVYSIYPGMAPCSITQFKYFNIIDIWILILSSIGPLVIMYADLTEQPWKLANTILFNKNEKKVWVGFGVALLVATNVCEIVVISVMHYPDSTFAETVTDSPVIACTLTILMVSCQLVSTGIGFGCVAAGSYFNDGIINVNSTAVLWTTECCGVFGEGYLTELKKYEPGKWPTQGMGRWKAFNWWRGRASRNAWQIWSCICTTNLRRDIMLCKQ